MFCYAQRNPLWLFVALRLLSACRSTRQRWCWWPPPPSPLLLLPCSARSVSTQPMVAIVHCIVFIILLVLTSSHLQPTMVRSNLSPVRGNSLAHLSMTAVSLRVPLFLIFFFLSARIDRLCCTFPGQKMNDNTSKAKCVTDLSRVFIHPCLRRPFLPTLALERGTFLRQCPSPNSTSKYPL